MCEKVCFFSDVMINSINDCFAGAIIPQIQVRQYIGGPDNAPNPITIHVYPGKNSVSSITHVEMRKV